MKSLCGFFVLKDVEAQKYDDIPTEDKSTSMPAPQERLSAILSETATLMEADGNQHWADWLHADAAKLESGDISGVEHFLGAFGGMGSLNDTYGRPGKSKPEDEKSLVEKICDRLEIACDLANRISRQNQKQDLSIADRFELP